MFDQTALILILVIPFIGAIFGWLIGRKNETYRDLFNILMTALEFLIVLFLYKRVMKEPILLFIPDIMGTGLSLRLDAFRYIFVFITTFIWVLTTMYSTQYLIHYKKRNRYYSFFMLTLFSTIGIFISENILNLFAFFEIMSFTSYALIIHDEDQYAHEAGKSYLAMAIGAGLVLLMGLFILYDYTGTLNISELGMKMKKIGNIQYLISGLMIIGFGTKASMFPLHVWLPKAHPAAPTPASAILSGILIKTGIFGIIVTVWMIEIDETLSTILFVLGLVNMFLGGFLALFQRNIKRILAYSSMSQAGYILVGIGLYGLLKDHKSVAIYGTLYHIVNHAIFKVLLFMGAGIIYMVLHELSINKIKGFGKNKTKLKAVFFIGLLAIIGMPGFNGFISKTILHEALGVAHHMYHNIWFTIAEIIFTLSSSFTVAYLLKIFITVFVEKNEQYNGQLKHLVKKRAIFPMATLAGVIVYIGIFPNSISPILQKAIYIFGTSKYTPIHFYKPAYIISSIKTIFIGVLIYIIFVQKVLRKEVEGEKIYINPSLNWFNLERDLYKPVLVYTFRFTSAIFHFIDRIVVDFVYLTQGVIQSISGIQIQPKKYKKQKIRRFSIQYIIKDMKFEFKSLQEVIEEIGKSVNSLRYAVFIVAILLASLLVFLVV
ncbi:complex I subunit 5 family protein [Inediibacterium massiliense]|uniref:complex I subunit 5 family protein n=1 Tax=Inediibacterium massiliense TaxID=1658111 RepID=UPI0006B5415C|nr:proton-conducting transporter membrane subunit [Inediibacterium massiliense]